VPSEDGCDEVRIPRLTRFAINAVATEPLPPAPGFARCDWTSSSLASFCRGEGARQKRTSISSAFKSVSPASAFILFESRSTPASYNSRREEHIYCQRHAEHLSQSGGDDQAQAATPMAGSALSCGGLRERRLNWLMSLKLRWPRCPA
jgi:hypothetical protein